MAGRDTEARHILAELKRRGAEEHIDPLAFAWVAAGVGDKDAAFAWLEQAYQEGSSWLIFLNAKGYYAPPCTDPRFDQLLRKVGLEAD